MSRRAARPVDLSATSCLFRTAFPVLGLMVRIGLTLVAGQNLTVA
jgi:hypothetical protein